MKSDGGPGGTRLDLMLDSISWTDVAQLVPIELEHGDHLLASPTIAAP